MKSSLTSEKLLFQSFQHSQGIIQPQLYIFRYMELQFGIPVDLHPSPESWHRFTQYIEGVNSKEKHVHLKTAGYQRGSASRQVYEAFKGIRKVHNTKFGKKVRSKNLEKTTHGLTHSIIEGELSVLDAGPSFPNRSKQTIALRQQRQKARVTAGKASFLLHYGRDQKPTGFAEFDQMYQDMWKAASEATSESWLKLLERHNNTIAIQEAEHLGALCLAREASL